MDNVNFHKDRLAMVARGYNALFAPPYSPDHNGPVENSFAKIKTTFRSGWPWKDGVDSHIAASVCALTKADILGSFQSLRSLCSR